MDVLNVKMKIKWDTASSRFAILYEQFKRLNKLTQNRLSETLAQYKKEVNFVQIERKAFQVSTETKQLLFSTTKMLTYLQFIETRTTFSSTTASEGSLVGCEDDFISATCSGSSTLHNL